MRLFWTTLAVLVLLSFGIGASCRRIAPDEIGLRTLNVGGERGLVPKDFDAGFYRAIWLVEQWETLPRSVQRVLYTSRPDLRGADDWTPIEAKTLDGDSVTIEATILFRIADGKGFEVYRSSGPGDTFKRRARDLASPLIAQALAMLHTEDLYDQRKRNASMKAMEDDLRGSFRSLQSLDLVDFSITGITFDSKYEEELEKKKVATQKKLLATSQTSLNEEEGVKNQIVQETENKVKLIQNELANRTLEIQTNATREVERILNEAKAKAAAIEAEATIYAGDLKKKSEQELREADAYVLDLQRKAVGGNPN
ncbi:MAG TPA: SPFH domain-containing protein, partial [Planctomycetota bacterium]|nr:SPFH domain-containing protein [Planctomycetota bacterium]